MSRYSQIPEVALRPLLERRTVQSSAPCRIDFGDSWDLKGMALLGQNLPPITVNIALDLRATIRILPFRDGWVRVSGSGFRAEEYPLSEVDLSSPLSFIFAILFHFAVSGVHITIETEFPPRSGLGGSSAISVAVIASISKALTKLDQMSDLSKSQIVRLAHDIEDGLRISYAGMQDQAAAVYGGVNKWRWDYRSSSDPFSREELATEADGPEFAKHLLLAYIGRKEMPADITAQEVRGFLNGTTREQWYEMHYAAAQFAQALVKRDWKEAALQLQRGTANRLRFAPDISTPASLQLVKEAEQCGCGAAFAGAPKGSVWAIGSDDAINQLHQRWGKMVESVQGGRLLNCKVDFTGLKSFSEPASED